MNLQQKQLIGISATIGLAAIAMALSQYRPQINQTITGTTPSAVYTCKGTNRGLLSEEYLKKAITGEYGQLIYEGNTGMESPHRGGILLLMVPSDDTRLELLVSQDETGEIESAAILSPDLDCRGTSPRFIIEPLTDESRQLVHAIGKDYLKENKPSKANMDLIRKFLDYAKLIVY